jgi:hypothetical protein
LALCVIAAGFALFRRQRARKRKAVMPSPNPNVDDTENSWGKSELPVKEAERSELHDGSWDPKELDSNVTRAEMADNERRAEMEGLSQPVELPAGR